MDAFGHATGGSPSEIARAEAEAERAIDAVLSAFAESFRAACALEDDAALAEDLATEARPAAHALRDALLATEEDPAAFEPHRLDHHEGMAMIHLLGRRAAIVGASPGAATLLTDRLAEVLGTHTGRALPAAFVEALRGACVEGFVRGHEETLRERFESQAAEALIAAPLAPGCWWLSLAGAHAAETIAERSRAFGRELFGAEARAAVLNLRGLSPVDRGMAAAVLEALAAGQTVGAEVHLAGVDDAWAPLLGDLGAPADQLHAEPQAALRAALAAAGHEIRPRLGARLRKLLGNPQ